ncbi:MAG: hypothetical protein OXU45_10060 [Candidatus Melainabacteria bacterium]|nr:hypothetical protein [Candidatus Melainabacteria bacterium]
MDFLITIIYDLGVLLKSPSRFATELQRRDWWTLSRASLIFVLVMNTYYLLLPSFWIFHILIILFVMLAIGTMYYFMQELLILYKEEHELEMADDELMYLLIYAFAIANLPALFVNLIVHTLVLSLTESLLIGVFVLSFVGLITFAVAVYFPYRLFKSLVPQASFVETIVRSFVSASKERVGINAIQELMLDWQRIR